MSPSMADERRMTDPDAVKIGKSHDHLSSASQRSGRVHVAVSQEVFLEHRIDPADVERNLWSRRRADRQQQ